MDRYKTLKIMTDGELHAKLKEEAEKENVSLNTFIIYQLALMVGKDGKKKKHKERTSTTGFDHLFSQPQAGIECQ